MIQSVRIQIAPAGINPDFAAVLVDLTVPLQPELTEWTRAIREEKLCFYLRASDVLAALTAKLGVSEATRYNPHLLIGRPIRIPCASAELIPAT